nr:putative inactive leucine-rich repeat receptor-like protein kinase [Quercus suber]
MIMGIDVEILIVGIDVEGRNPLKLNNFANNSNGSLVEWTAHFLTSSSDLYNVINESLIGQGFEDEIFELLRIAYACLKLFPSQRPMTLELCNAIRILGERNRLTCNSEILWQSEIATARNFGEIVKAEIT